MSLASFPEIRARTMNASTTPYASNEELFAEDVFTERVMRQRLPKDVFKALQRTMNRGEPLNP
ncbi:MAG: glutamine synthetase III, partial [Phycisphaerae bacterium]|nr:glutamine synthetase III [Phycisphaerae bacterium]